MNNRMDSIYLIFGIFMFMTGIEGYVHEWYHWVGVPCVYMIGGGTTILVWFAQFIRIHLKS